MALCQQNKTETALPLLQKAVSLAPANVTAVEDLAAAYIQLNQ
jgi:Flp pilus assembly protein TadD